MHVRPSGGQTIHRGASFLHQGEEKPVSVTLDGLIQPDGNIHGQHLVLCKYIIL